MYCYSIGRTFCIAIPIAFAFQYALKIVATFQIAIVNNTIGQTPVYDLAVELLVQKEDKGETTQRR